MDYVQIVNLISQIIFIIYAVLMAHFVVFGIVGIFKKTKYPHSDDKCRYGIVISARNEENVIGNLILSIKNNNYPMDKIEIFVAAHNCDDKTASVASSLGAHVYEINDPTSGTKGCALKALFEGIDKDYGIMNFDGFIMLDADNLIKDDYIEKLNDAFNYFDKKSIVTSYRNSKNFGYNLMSGCYGIYFVQGNAIESRGRSILGCSARVQGTGFVIPSVCVKKGWNYLTLTEDWEFTVDQDIAGYKIRYTDEAVFYDEQPTNVRIMFRQRVRWARGHLLVFYLRIKDLLKSLFSRKTKARFSIYDITIYILPFCLVLFIIGFIQCLLLMLAPLFTSYSFYDIFIGEITSFYDLVYGGGYLIGMARSLIFGYLGFFLLTALLFIVDHKKIKGVSFIKKIGICLTYPIFMTIQFIIDIVALFSRKLTWKVIPHKDRTNIFHIHKKKSR